MKNYTITISEAQEKALLSVAISAQDWIQNVVSVRCNAAIEEIVAAEIQRKLAAGESISGSKEDIVMAAAIESAAERTARADAEWAAQLAAEQAAQQQG